MDLNIDVDQTVEEFTGLIEKAVQTATKYQHRVEIPSKHYFGPLGVGQNSRDKIRQVIVEKLSKKYLKFQIEIIEKPDPRFVLKSWLILNAPCDWTL
jgi:hypothetical protein